MSLLSVSISAEYHKRAQVLRAVRLDVDAGEIFGLVGESGCGKSTLSLAVMGLLKYKSGKVSGSIKLDGRELAGLREKEWSRIRGKQIALVLQSPMSALNPELSLERHLWEAWRAHEPRDRERFKARVQKILAEVRLPADIEFLKRRPAQISVGQAQRVLIGMAILHDPMLLIADEPTSALDAIHHSEILALFAELSRSRKMAILFITHDLAAMARVCDRVAIMRAGEIVECDRVAQLLENPQHEYTKELLRRVIYDRSLAKPAHAY